MEFKFQLSVLCSLHLGKEWIISSTPALSKIEGILNAIALVGNQSKKGTTLNSKVGVEFFPSIKGLKCWQFYDSQQKNQEVKASKQSSTLHKLGKGN